MFFVMTESSIVKRQTSEDYSALFEESSSSEILTTHKPALEPYEPDFFEPTTEQKLVLIEKLEANSAAHAKLEKLMPKAPECGGNLRNRILGGTETLLGDHPWTVLIESHRCELMSSIIHRPFL
jgi:hypothetical protein